MLLAYKQIKIGGMTCVNCQHKIEQRLRNTAGVIKAAGTHCQTDLNRVENNDCLYQASSESIYKGCSDFCCF